MLLINALTVAVTSPPFSNSLIKAVPMIAPFAYLHAESNVSLSRMPNPTSTGFFNCSNWSFCRYFSTALKSLSFPVVAEELTGVQESAA
jgi:hypothetical protein